MAEKPTKGTLFIACSEAKRNTTRALPAINLYTARQFKLARQLKAKGWDVVILSARYGLVEAECEIHTYNQKLTERRAQHLALRPPHELLGRLRAPWYVYGGELYRRVIREWAAATFGSSGELQELTGPNRGNGDHYSALKALVASVPSPREHIDPRKDLVELRSHCRELLYRASAGGDQEYAFDLMIDYQEVREALVLIGNQLDRMDEELANPGGEAAA